MILINEGQILPPRLLIGYLTISENIYIHLFDQGEIHLSKSYHSNFHSITYEYRNVQKRMPGKQGLISPQCYSHLKPEKSTLIDTQFILGFRSECSKRIIPYLISQSQAAHSKSLVIDD